MPRIGKNHRNPDDVRGGRRHKQAGASAIA
jgi:hypothetical protein